MVDKWIRSNFSGCEDLNDVMSLAFCSNLDPVINRSVCPSKFVEVIECLGFS